MVAMLHLMLAGIWLGCIATEVAFERALIGKGREQELTLALLHRRVDLFVEIPVFVLVAASGAYLLAVAESISYLKVGFGMIAVVANLFCAWLVFRRADAARLGMWRLFERLDHLQHKAGAVVLVAVLAAMAVGLGESG